MKRKFLALVLSASLLVGCGDSSQKRKIADINSTAQSNSIATKDNSVLGPGGTTSVQQLGDEEAAVAQKEWLKIISFKEAIANDILEFSRNLGVTTSREEAMQKLSDRIYQLSVNTQQEIDQIKVTNQDIRNYVEKQHKQLELNKQLHEKQTEITRQTKSGGVTEANIALLKELRASQGQLLQQEAVLTEKLSQAGSASPAKELLQIKNIQNKEMIQFMALWNDLPKATASTESMQKSVDLSRSVDENTIAELKKLVINTPEINEYRNRLVALGELKAKARKAYPAKLMNSQNVATNTTEKLSPEQEQILKKLSDEAIELSKMSAQLTTKYSQ
ncbi:MAG: hypothetical protein WDW21_02060 [Neisseriaceae bacterium]